MGDATVRLRPLEPDDADAITHLLENDFEGVMQTARIPWPFTRKDAEHFIARVFADGGGASAILAGDRAEFAGVIGVVSGEEPEIGYWVGKPFRGKGLASAAVRMVTERLASDGALRVRAHVFPDNPARVLQQCGFRRAGEVEQYLPLRGGMRVLHLYVLELAKTPS